jgi:tetratricopeptide (TPR) repeat protein
MVKPKQLVLIALIAIVIFATPGCKKKSLDQLLEQKRFGDAETLCENLEGKDKIDCLRRIAGIYVRDNKFERAALLYKKAGAPVKVLEAYHMGEFYSESEEYAAQQTGKAKTDCAVWLGKRYYKTGKYNKAIQYYTIAGIPEMVEYITSKIPVFQMVETMQKSAKSVKDYETKNKVNQYADVLQNYIYLRQHRNWEYSTDNDNDKKAAEIYQKAFTLIQDEAAPVFIEKVKKILEDEKVTWTPQQLQPLAYDYTRLNSLIGNLDFLRKIAGYRRFFSRFPEKPKEKKTTKEKEIKVELPPIATGLNFDSAYKKALENAAGILETVKYSKDLDIKTDYKILIEDFGIDIENLDYITSMLKNIQIRINEIKRRAGQFRKVSGKTDAESFTRRHVHEFIAACGRVLSAIGKADYKEANRELLSSYEKAEKAMPVKKRRVQQ